MFRVESDVCITTGPYIGTHKRIPIHYGLETEIFKNAFSHDYDAFNIVQEACVI